MSENARELFKNGVCVIFEISGESALFEAGCLFEDICSIRRCDLVTNPDLEVSCTVAQKFMSACDRRAGGEPLQYILGKWEFMGLEFAVNPGVLIPRADTETVVEYILANYSGAPKILDMCCGSGCIGLALKHFIPDAQVVLADVSDKALKTSRNNARRLGLDVTVCKCDLLSGYKGYFEDQSFDIIVSNPPYIKTGDLDGLSAEVRHEPLLALDGGEDGLKFYRALALYWENALIWGGEMIFESGYDTANDIQLIFLECEYTDIKYKKDLNGITRVISAKRRINYD